MGQLTPLNEQVIDVSTVVAIKLRLHWTLNPSNCRDRGLRFFKIHLDIFQPPNIFDDSSGISAAVTGTYIYKVHSLTLDLTVYSNKERKLIEAIDTTC